MVLIFLGKEIEDLGSLAQPYSKTTKTEAEYISSNSEFNDPSFYTNHHSMSLMTKIQAQ